MDAKRRRVSSGWGLKQAGGEDVFFEPNDDEAERRKSRTSINPNKSSSNGNESGTLPNNTLGTKRKVVIQTTEKEDDVHASGSSKPVGALSNEEIIELYANCIKLCTENKINTKNAWQLKIIDYMDEVLETDGDTTDFQQASCTLDASIKVYSCRVDSIHSDTYKILGGLSRTTDKGDDEGDDAGPTEAAKGEEDQEKKEDAEKKKRAKRIPVGGINTLEANVENLNAKKFDLEFIVDPLFRKTSAAFDEGGAKGLLLNHLSVYQNCELIFDSADAVDTTAKHDEKDPHIDIAELRGLLFATGEDLEDLEVCPTFSNFSFEKTAGGGVDFNPADVGSDDDRGVASEDENDVADFPAYEEVELDEGGIDHNAVEKYQDTFAQHINKEQVVPAVARIADDSWSDFQYFNPKLAKNWSGPEHWRFTTTARAASSKENGAAEVKKKAPKRKADGFFVDFFGPPPDESLFAPPGRAQTTLSAAALKKATEMATTLPPDVHYDIKMLTQLFSKPKWIIPPLSKRRKWDDEHAKESTEDGPADNTDAGGGDWFDYTNSNAAGGSGVNNDDYDTGFDHDGGGDYDDIGAAGDAATSQFGLGSSGFVNQPQRVQKVNINYAKFAKKIDVKVLKSSIWSELCDTPKAADKKNEEKFEGDKGFDQLLSGVSERVKGNQAVGEMSVAMCFICVLHLANEKGLSLKQDDIDSLTINSGRG